MSDLHNFLFGIYPYIALSIFLLGSLIRFDREQYTWKSDSSQMLRSAATAAGQQSVPHRHPVPVFRPCGRTAHAALAV